MRSQRKSSVFEIILKKFNLEVIASLVHKVRKRFNAHPRVARLAISWPNFTNLAFFEVNWPLKNKFGNFSGFCHEFGQIFYYCQRYQTLASCILASSFKRSKHVLCLLLLVAERMRIARCQLTVLNVSHL